MPVRTSRRRGLARKEVIALIGAGVVVAAILVPVAIYMSGPGNKTVCRAQLDIISKALSGYAAENKGIFPVAAHATAIEKGKGAVTYAPGKIGRYRDAAPPADTRELSTTTNLYTLIRLGRARPEDFICPSSHDAPSREANPASKWDFARYTEVSYGYQVPYGQTGTPRKPGDPNAVIVADKGPYGAALEAGGPDPGPPTADRKAKGSKEWRAWNNANHKKDQNVLYSDGRVEEHEKPLAGVNKDNIYTRWSDLAAVAAHDPLAWSHGTPPTGNETPFGDTDSLIYP